jgi:hypothetical protein
MQHSFVFRRSRDIAYPKEISIKVLMVNFRGQVTDVQKKSLKGSESLAKSLPLLQSATSQRVQTPFFISSWRSKTEFPPQITVEKKNRGELICCLKVEIKSGVYQMLPIHQVPFI